jgi:hypothetical protein
MRTVARVLRDRERRENVKHVSLWFLLWQPASCVFMMGVLFLPPLRAPWESALVWMFFGVAWVSLVSVADRHLRRPCHRRKSADAGKPLQDPRAWRFAMYFCVIPVAVLRQRAPSDLSSAAALGAAALLIVLAETAAAAVARRRAAERRRKEVAALARQF